MFRKSKKWARRWWRLLFAVGLFFHAQATELAVAQPSPALSINGGTGPSRGQCSEITVESRVDINSTSPTLDRPDRLVDFTITVFVTNQCRELLQLLPVSFVAYETNFPPLLRDTAQPPECLGQQSSFSGVVPPAQKVPFTFRAQGCAFPSSPTDTPRVTVETGRVITDKGERLIPTVTEILP